MLDEPAAGIGVGWREASSTPGLVGLRHGDGDVLASPPAQRSPATSAVSPDGSHLYPVEVQSSFGKCISHQSMGRDTGSRARALWEDDLRMAAELARTGADQTHNMRELGNGESKRGLCMVLSQQKAWERQEEEAREQRRAREKEWARERERERREAEVELNQRRLEERILMLGLEQQQQQQQQQQLHLESARSLQYAYDAASPHDHVPPPPAIEDVLYATVKSLRSRLTSFYQTFAPHKLARVDAIVSSFVSRGSSPEALSHLNDELRETYGCDLEFSQQQYQSAPHLHQEANGYTSMIHSAQNAPVLQAQRQNGAISISRHCSPTHLPTASASHHHSNHLSNAAGRSHPPFANTTASDSPPFNNALPVRHLGVRPADFSPRSIQGAGLLRQSADVGRARQVLDSLSSLSQEEARHNLAQRQRERPWHSVGQQGRGELDNDDGGPPPEPLDGGYELRSLRKAYQTAHLEHMLRLEKEADAQGFRLAPEPAPGRGVHYRHGRLAQRETHAQQRLDSSRLFSLLEG